MIQLSLGHNIWICRLEIVMSIFIFYVHNQRQKLIFISDTSFIGTIQVDFSLSSLQQSLRHI